MPAGIKVEYSYRKWRFEHSQFVHRSGAAFVQILSPSPNKFDQPPGFLFLSRGLNLLNIQPRARHQVHPDSLRLELQTLCTDETKLAQLWSSYSAESILIESPLSGL